MLLIPFIALLLVAISLTLLYYHVIHVRSERWKLRDHILTLDPRKNHSEIINWIYYTEFPFLAHKALEFAFFRTYGIPSVSKLLDKTGGFAPEKIGKRYDDTELLMREMMEQGGASARADIAIQRMNFIHSQYRIDNVDFIYVWALFVVESVRWIDRFEYRKTTDVEKQAFYYHWVEIGHKMGIKDLPKSFEDTMNYMEHFEKKHMVYQPSNHRIADHTVNLFLSAVPFHSLKQLGRIAIYSMLDERLSKSLGYPVWPRRILGALTDSVLLLRGQFIRYFMLPRKTPLYRLGTIDESTGIRQLNYHLYDVVYPNGYDLKGLGPVGCPYGKLAPSGSKLQK